MRRGATQKARSCCQEIRVATEVRPTDAPDRAVGSVGNSLRALNPTVEGPMPSRTVLSTSCDGPIAPVTGIFKAGSVRSDRTDLGPSGLDPRAHYNVPSVDLIRCGLRAHEVGRRDADARINLPWLA
jgi:hypothetical protein